jgi:hypothetical protein
LIYYNYNIYIYINYQEFSSATHLPFWGSQALVPPKPQDETPMKTALSFCSVGSVHSKSLGDGYPVETGTESDVFSDD